MRPTRRTQPYRRGAKRQLGPVLEAMSRGRTTGNYNPADITRAMHRKARRRRRARAAR